MTPPARVFLYAEFEVSLSSDEVVSWRKANPAMHTVAGLRNRTLLSGIEQSSLGGLYEFDPINDARAYANGALGDFARSVGGRVTLRFLSADVIAEASADTAFPYFGN